MRSYAIALFVGAAAAAEIDNMDYGKTQYGKNNPWAKPAAPPIKTYYGSNQQYGGHHAGHHAPVYAKPSSPQYGGGGYGPQKHSYQGHQGHHGPHSHNPFQPWNSHKPEGWYSTHQQYSPPKIAYVAAQLHKPAYGICQFANASDVNFALRFGQMPGHPVSIMHQVDPATGLDGTVYGFTLNTYGDIGDDEDGMACGNVGKEFNPLSELVYNMPNPYQDPSRGAIDDQTLVEPTGGATMATHIQPNFMQNLSGKNSIIGKSVTVMNMSDPDNPALEGCCVIGDAQSPIDPNANAGYAHNHHHHGHGHGHGGHGGHGHGYGGQGYSQGYGGHGGQGYSQGYGGHGGQGYSHGNSGHGGQGYSHSNSGHSGQGYSHGNSGHSGQGYRQGNTGHSGQGYRHGHGGHGHGHGHGGHGGQGYSQGKSSSHGGDSYGAGYGKW